MGAYTDFAVPESLPEVAPSEMIFGDVNAEVDGVENGVAILLYVEKGYLSFLEFATYLGEWPEDPKLSGLGYFREEPMQPNGFSLIPVTDRDPQAVARALKGAHGQNAA
ncbi:MAG: hypothetical protein AB3X41_11820 [Leptothrix ochracea]|uniref:hypothetical protein n=1 Tax=Leptothrix ochracea TaxID=735331 RepID=UPI0034E1A1E9